MEDFCSGLGVTNVVAVGFRQSCDNNEGYHGCCDYGISHEAMTAATVGAPHWEVCVVLGGKAAHTVTACFLSDYLLVYFIISHSLLIV